MKQFLAVVGLGLLLAGCAAGGYGNYGIGPAGSGGAGPYDNGPRAPNTGATYMG